MSNPFAALFEDVDTSTDPMLAEMDLSDGPFAPLAPPAPPARGPAAKPSAKAAEPPKSTSQSAVHEMLSPPVRGGGKKANTIQQALVVTWEKGEVPNLMELNDLLASGWRVATTAGFPTADGSRGSLLVVVEM